MRRAYLGVVVACLAVALVLSVFLWVRHHGDRLRVPPKHFSGDSATAIRSNAPNDPQEERLQTEKHKADDTTRIGVEPKEATTTPDNLSCRLFGSLVDAPIEVFPYAPWTPLFSVYARNLQGNRVDGKVDGAGQYVLADLDAGEWLVSALGVEHSLATAQVVLEPGEARRLDIPLKRRLMVSVFLANRDGEAIPSSSDVLQWSVVASEDGRIAAEVPYPLLKSLRFVGASSPLESGAMYLERDFREHGIGNIDVVPSLFLGPREDIICRLALDNSAPPFIAMLIGATVVDCRPADDSAELTFILEEDASRRLTGALYFQIANNGEAPTDHEQLQISWGEGLITIPEGIGQRIRVSGLLPGEREVAVEGSGIEALVSTVVIRPASEVDLGAFDIASTGKIVGRAITNKGDPVVNARIGCWKRADRSGQIEPIGQYGWTTDSRGEFSMEVTRGEYFLRVVDGFAEGNMPIGSQSVSVWVSGEVQSVELTAMVLEEVTCTSSKPSDEEKELLFFDRNDVLLSAKLLASQTILVPLPPGATECRIYDAGGAELLRRRFTVCHGVRLDF